MSSSRQKTPHLEAPQAAAPVSKYSPDLSFPVSYREQQKYLELADRFLQLDQAPPKRSNVVPIDHGRRLKKAKKAA
jgi:hypothetical protein